MGLSMLVCVWAWGLWNGMNFASSYLKQLNEGVGTAAWWLCQKQKQWDKTISYVSPADTGILGEFCAAELCINPSQARGSSSSKVEERAVTAELVQEHVETPRRGFSVNLYSLQLFLRWELGPWAPWGGGWAQPDAGPIPMCATALGNVFFPFSSPQLSAVSVRAHQRATLAQGWCLQRQRWEHLGWGRGQTQLPSPYPALSPCPNQSWREGVTMLCASCPGQEEHPAGHEDVASRERSLAVLKLL